MRRVPRIAGGIVLSAVAVVALLLGATFTVLRTSWGSDLARRLALPRINALIAGDLEVGHFRFGGDRLTLGQVVLRGADAQVVARIRGIDVTFSPSALLRGRLAIGAAELHGPALFLRNDAAGWNLANALARRHPLAAPVVTTPPTEPSGGLALDLGRLRVSDGRVELQSASEAGPPRTVRASDINIEATAHAEGGLRVFSGDLSVSAEVSEPLRAPLALRLSGHGRANLREAALTTTLGDAVVDATVSEAGPGRVTARLTRAHLTPALVRALLPMVELRIPLELTAEAHQEGAALTFATTVGGAAGTLAARGLLDTVALRARGVEIHAQDVDLGMAFEGLPGSALSLSATLEGGGKDPRALTGNLRLDVPAGRLDGAPVGPLTLKLNAVAGRYKLERLQLLLPGLVVAGRGVAGPERLDLHLELVAADLARTARALRRFRALHLPAVAGRGKVEVSVSGTLAAPGVGAHAALARLVVGRDRVEGLVLDARVPDLHAPDRATLDLRAASARVSDRVLRDVRVRARSITQRLTVDAHVGGPIPIGVSGAGTWGPRRESLALERFELRTPQVDWKLQQTAQLSLRSEHMAVEGLVLRAGDQTVRADLDKRGERLRAHVAIERLDLGALSHGIAPPELVLAGRLDVQAAATGTMSNPTVTASVTLLGGRFGRYRDLSLRLDDGRYGHGRASGELGAQGLGTSLHARFDVPVEWPPPDRSAPLELALTVPATDLSLLRAAFALPIARRFTGKAGLSLEVSGTEGAPSLRLGTWARDLTVDGQAMGDVSLHVAADDTTPVTVALDIEAPRSSPAAAAAAHGRPKPLVCVGSLTLRTGLALASFTRRLPTIAELMRAHFDVSGDLRGLPLDLIARLAGTSQLTGGTAAVRVSGQGTASSPSGALNVQVVQATGPRFPPTDARLDASFGQRDTRLALRVLRGPKLLVSASAVLGLASRQLRDRAAVVTAPVTVRASLGPLRLHHGEVLGADGAGSISGVLSSDARAAVTIDGTIERPVVKLTASLENARMGTHALGNAHASITYASRDAEASIEYTTPAGGDLRLKAHGAVDLGYGQVTRGLDPRQIQIEASLTARRLDLSWLSDLSPDVRKVSGEMSATLRAHGDLANPHVSGQLGWVNGGLTLRGLGAYRDVHLAAHGDERAVWIDDLRLASGDGTARLTARASRGIDRYRVESRVNLHRFPFYGQGQPLALVSVDTHLTGDASSVGANVSAKISEAHVELTDAKQKNLQPPNLPADVILMEGDQPIDRAEATRLRAAMAAVRKDATGSPAAPKQLPPPAKPFALHLAVDAPRNLWVNGKDAALELGLARGFHADVDGGSRIYGQVVVRRGRIDVLGRRFDLQAGSVVNFTGPVGTASLDVSAKYFNETENINVLLTAKGVLDHLAIAVSSPDRPDLTEGQLYTLIVTGRLQLGGNGAGSASASGEAASLVGGLVASQLQRALARKLPLDVLTLQAGEGLTGSRLEAGTYLTSKLYAGYVGRVGANPALLQNRNAVHLEYQLSRRWSFDAEYGDVGTGSADLTWTKNY